MPTSRTTAWTITLALLSSAAGGPLAAASDRTAAGSPKKASLPAIEALFGGYVTSGKMPGVVGAFGSGDEPTIFVSRGRIADDADAPAAGPDSLWRVYSMTKPITAMAAMILIDEHKLRLDQPVSDFIPAFGHMTVLTDPEHSLASRPARSAVTIRELMTHTSGLGYSVVNSGPIKQAYERSGVLPFAADPKSEAQMRAVRPKTLAEFANRAAALPLVAEPGTAWNYSIGLDVLARVVEVASGMPFDRFVRKRLFEPLRMSSSYWQVPASQKGRLATDYIFIGEKRVPLDPAGSSVFLEAPDFPYGGAGLVMSAHDYDRFLHMLQNRGTLDGVRIMRPETADLAMSNLLPPGVTFKGGGPGDAGDDIPLGFGAGGMVTLGDGPGRIGKGTFGWGGAAGTVAWVNPHLRVRGTVMVNYMPDSKWPVRKQTVEAVSRLAAWHDE